MSPPFTPPSVLNHPLITPSLTRYHLLLCLPPSPFLFISPTLRTQSTPQPFTHPPQTILTSQWLSPSPTSTTLRLTSPDSLPPYFVNILINFPLSHHFFLSTPNTSPVIMGAHRNFSKGGQAFGGAPKKFVKGGPHIFFRQALKYVYRGGGGIVLMPAEFFSRGPQIY